MNAALVSVFTFRSVLGQFNWGRLKLLYIYFLALNLESQCEMKCFFIQAGCGKFQLGSTERLSSSYEFTVNTLGLTFSLCMVETKEARHGIPV